jgi:hypothetical protein
MQDTSFDPGWKSGENTLLLSPAGIEKTPPLERSPGAVNTTTMYL